MDDPRNSKYKLTVGVVCYNHGPFVEKLLDSIYSQERNFPIKVLIGNDASTDNTKAIIDSFQQKYADFTEVLHHNTNQGVNALAKGMIDWVEGEYLAITDGDDYWSDKFKLQKQVDFLDANRDYNGCFHDVKIVNKLNEGTHNGKIIHSQSKVFFKSHSQISNYRPDVYSSDIIGRLIAPTSSLVLRYNYNLKEELRYFDDEVLSFDWLMQVLHIRGSKFRFINEILSEYNDHSGGLTKRLPNSMFTESNIRVLKALFKHSNFRGEKRSIYNSLHKEYGYLLFNKKDMGWWERQKNNYMYWYYGQLATMANLKAAAKNR